MIDWNKEISETIRPIFIKFLGMVDVLVQMLSGTGFPIGQETLPRQPILLAKSATRLPSWDWHSTTDSRVGKWMGALTAQKSCLHRVKIS